jgi:hypothetical protein
MLRTQFLMKLGDSPSLLTGQFEILDDDKVLKAYPATSGVAGYQSSIDDTWRRGRGPIPRSIPGKRDYSINIKGRYSLATKGIEGLAYPISPDPIISLEGDASRSEIMLHRDANVPGSAGCIVLRVSVDEYKEFNDYIWSIARDVTKLPLLVKYI